MNATTMKSPGAGIGKNHEVTSSAQHTMPDSCVVDGGGGGGGGRGREAWPGGQLGGGKLGDGELGDGVVADVREVALDLGPVLVGLVVVLTAIEVYVRAIAHRLSAMIFSQPRLLKSLSAARPADAKSSP